MADSMWKPLDTTRKEIRLLRLQPNANVAASIECVLETISILDDEAAEPTSRDFAAISYVCGDPEQTTTGVINGHPFPILKSLSTAMKHLRSPTDELKLWADQSCINQRDLKEKSDQILLMKWIYSKADVVRICLPSECSLDDAWTVDEVLNQCGQDQLKYDEWDSKLVADASTFCSVLSRLYPFFTHAWWDRIWTIQEICLSKRAAFHYGSYELPHDYKTWATAINVSSQSESVHGQGLRTRAAKLKVLIADRLRRISEGIAVVSTNRASMNLHRRVPGSTPAAFANFEARCISLSIPWYMFICSSLVTDERDEVYGALSFFPESIQVSLEADYQMSVEQPLLRQADNASVLGARLALSPPSLNQLTFGWNKWAAGVKPSPLIAVDEELLRVQAILIDSVQKSACRNLPSTSPDLSLSGSTRESVGHHDTDRPYKIAEFHSRLICFYGFCHLGSYKNVNARYIGGGSMLRASCEANGSNLTLTNPIANDASSEEYEAWHRTPLAQDKPARRRLRPSPVEGFHLFHDAASLMQTHRGYVGTALSPLVQKGDIIAILGDATMPFILGPAQHRSPDSDLKTFTIVAQACIAGITHGELTDHDSALNVESENDKDRRQQWGGTGPDAELKNIKAKEIIIK